MTSFLRLLLLTCLLPCLASHVLSQQYRWTRLGGPGSMGGVGCIATNDGGTAVVGTMRNPANGSTDLVLALFTLQTTPAWVKSYGEAASEEGVDIIQSADGGFLLLGNTTEIDGGKKNILLIRVDWEGTVLWSRVYGGPDDDVAVSFQSISEGYVICGQTRSFGSRGWAGFLMTVTENGDPGWFRLYDHWNTDAASSVEQTEDGGFIATGLSYAAGAGMHDVLVFKTDRTGELQWSHLFGGPRDERGHTIHRIQGGGYFVNGNSHSYGNGAADALILRLNETGNLLWAKVLGTKGDDGFRKSIAETDSTVVLAGWMNPDGSPGPRPWIARMSLSGSLLFSGSIVDHPARAFDLFQRARGIPVLTGESIEGGDTGLVLIEAAITRRGQIPSGVSIPVTPVDLQSTRIPIRSSTALVPTNNITLRAWPVRIETLQRTGSIAIPGTNPEPPPKAMALKETDVLTDSASFIRAELTRIGNERERVAGEIPCNFEAADRALQSAEAALHIGDHRLAIRLLADAEYSLDAAPCGTVLIEELRALGSFYDGKRVTVIGTVRRKAPSVTGNGYHILLEDQSETLEAFHSGQLRGITVQDEVRAEGFFSFQDLSLDIISIEAVDQPVSTGLVVVLAAMLVTLVVLVFRLRRRQDSSE